jgi:hypothetical protein
MNLFLALTQANNTVIDITQELILRAKNTNKLIAYFLDEDESLVDITGDTVFFTVKNLPSDTDESAVLKKTITSLTDALNGMTEIVLSATDTESLLGNYIFDVKIKHGTEFYTVAEGVVCFRKSITIRKS